MFCQASQSIIITYCKKTGALHYKETLVHLLSLHHVHPLLKWLTYLASSVWRWSGVVGSGLKGGEVT